MEGQFDSNILFENIDYLIKKLDKKIGDVEKEAGVSVGYIARMNKVGGSRPGIDFIINIAKILNVSVDTLCTIEISKLTQTEEYLLNVVTKLYHDTVEGICIWEKESVQTLNNIGYDSQGNIEHPLFSDVDIDSDEESVFGPRSRVMFVSAAFGEGTEILNDCFHTVMKNGAKLYLMSVRHAVKAEQYDEAIEMWMYLPYGSREFLCNTINSEQLQQPLYHLYQGVRENNKHPIISNNARYILDAFMRNDISNDMIKEDDFDIPF